MSTELRTSEMTWNDAKRVAQDNGESLLMPSASQKGHGDREIYNFKILKIFISRLSLSRNTCNIKLKSMENLWITLTNLDISEVLSVQTIVHRKVSRLGLIKQGAHLVDSRRCGISRPKSISTTATLNLCYCTVRIAGELIRLTLTN